MAELQCTQAPAEVAEQVAQQGDQRGRSITRTDLQRELGPLLTGVAGGIPLWLHGILSPLSTAEAVRRKDREVRLGYARLYAVEALLQLKEEAAAEIEKSPLVPRSR